MTALLEYLDVTALLEYLDLTALLEYVDLLNRYSGAPFRLGPGAKCPSCPPPPPPRGRPWVAPKDAMVALTEGVIVTSMRRAIMASI